MKASIILLIGALSSCNYSNKVAHKEIGNFMLTNSKLKCITIEKDDGDAFYEAKRMTIVCGERRIK